MAYKETKKSGFTGERVDALDARANMIIAKGKPVSCDVTACNYNSATQKWDITFKNGKTFHYNSQNVQVLKDPVRIDPKSIQVRFNGKLFDNIQLIYAYKGNDKEYWHILFSTGYEHDYCTDELEISKSVLNRFGAKRVFEYLREVAEYVSVKTEDDQAILTKQYEKISFLDDTTAAAVYLDPDEYHASTDLDTTTPIFPFGCNESQYKAVCNALSNRISVIEGPPGTGKTQTILNIIANLVIQGKTVQVVSNNNSAIDNIIEKMASPKYGFGFIAALLGRDERKVGFIKHQSGMYPNLTSWDCKEYTSQKFADDLNKKSLEVQAIFKDINHLAELRQKLYSIQLEQEHFNSTIPNSTFNISRKKLTADKIMEFWQEYQDIQDGERKAGIVYRIVRYFSHGISVGKILKYDTAKVINCLQSLYYQTESDNIRSEIASLELKLKTIDAEVLTKQYTEMSLKCFRAKLAERYNYRKNRKLFTLDSLWKEPNDFLKEYPVVLSTTYTARSSLGKNAKYDYLIMDEASQVDVATGMLAISCAENAVIVGDIKQLPNVVTDQQKEHLSKVFRSYGIQAAYNFAENSFLQSLCILMGERIPQTTLHEHYRCHPQIIGFCNEKFYHGDLVVMTDWDETSALQLVTTVPGNHKRDQMNQRQIDVIREEILPKLNCPKNQIGIIAPYRNQVKQLIIQLSEPEIDIATVHKFQGREKDIIILSTVDDTVTEFSDDPNLLNVAVSRAKKKLFIVTADQEQPTGSNVGDLIEYIRYNNCDVSHSDISSVFDYLYGQYAALRSEYLKKHGRISQYDSENLMFGLIQEELGRRKKTPLGVVWNHPLQLLFRNQTKMSPKERQFVNTGRSHLDFLIYNTVSKKPVLAIEVDGFHYHKEGSRQAERDQLKNHILEEYGLPLLRFATNGSGEKEKLRLKLDTLLSYYS